MEQIIGKVHLNGYSTSKQKEEEKGEVSNCQELLIKDAIFVRHEGSLIKVKFVDILWLKADGNYTTLVCRKGVFSIRNILKNFESELPSKDFMRIHKSYVVRIDEIESISSKELNVSGDLVPVGRTYYHALINGIQKLGLTGE